MSSKGLKTDNVGWEVDLSLMFEGTEVTAPDENDPLHQASFTLEIGESCRPKAEHLQSLKAGQDYKILIRRESQNEYWYLDIEGKQDHFTSTKLEFWCSQWEKI